jgi:hypothetical protein
MVVNQILTSWTTEERRTEERGNWNWELGEDSNLILGVLLVLHEEVRASAVMLHTNKLPFILTLPFSPA